MRALSSWELLRAWEQGIGASGVDRALLLLGAACKDSPEQDPAQYSVGERDAHLLTLREWTFGPEVSAVTHCPKCADALELNFRIDDLRAGGGAERTAEPLALEDGDYRVKFRLPNSLDLRALQGAGDSVAKPDEQILQRCLLEVTCKGESVSVEQLPETVVVALSERMTEADPQAEVELALECVKRRDATVEIRGRQVFDFVVVLVEAGGAALRRAEGIRRVEVGVHEPREGGIRSGGRYSRRGARRGRRWRFGLDAAEDDERESEER